MALADQGERMPQKSTFFHPKLGTGIVFHPVDVLALEQALQKLLALYARRPVWAQMQKAAMAQPVGWQTSAQAYAALYEAVRR